MRFRLSITVLLLAVAPALLAQDLTNVSLGDVARQTRAHAGAVKKSWDDQNSDFGRDDSGTACGAPIASLPNGYVSGMVGRPLNDAEISQALVRWLDKHPDLDVMHPEDVARIEFPRTPAQAQLNQAAAHAAVQHWLQETSAASDSGNPAEAGGAVAAVMSTPLKSNAESLLMKAVRAEQQRRINSDGSAADKAAEAVNLYSICESRRQAQFEPEVDKLAKAEFQKRLSAGAATETAQGK